MTRKRRIFIFLLAVAISPLIFTIALWLWLSLSNDPFNHILTKFSSWPVACSLRGCITTTDWHKHHQARTTFTKTTNLEAPSVNDSLTTLVRQHLISEAFIYSPVTMRDAIRYREEILQARDESKIISSTGLALNDYDRLVILPLLQQENMRRERNISDYDQLFQQLAQEISVWVLPSTIKWNKEEARVVGD